MLSQIGRAAIRRIGAGAPQPSTNQVIRGIWQLRRVRASEQAKNDSPFPQVAFPFHRFYATASKSTQTANTKSKTPAVRKPRTEAAAPKKVADKTSTKASKKPVKKKATPKPKSKPIKKVLTPEQRKVLAEKTKVVELSEAALLGGPSKPSRQTAFNRIMSETLISKGKEDSLGNINNRFREAAHESREKYQLLKPADLEVRLAIDNNQHLVD